jgi:uncharacterized protein (DUF433 family)
MSTAINTLLVSTPDTCGGRLRIDGTRVTVHQIARLDRQGYNVEAIAEQYPELTMAQLYAALAHYYANQAEIDAEFAGTEEETDALSTAYDDSTETEIWLKAFEELQQSLDLTPAKAAEWQTAVREARR